MQGATYPNIDAVKDAVRLWAISLKREFRVVKSGSKEYEVKCVNDRCPLRVHVFKGKWKSNWKCSIVTEYTCLLSEVLPSHRNTATKCRILCPDIRDMFNSALPPFQKDVTTRQPLIINLKTSL